MKSLRRSPVDRDVGMFRKTTETSEPVALRAPLIEILQFPNEGISILVKEWTFCHALSRNLTIKSPRDVRLAISTSLLADDESEWGIRLLSTDSIRLAKSAGAIDHRRTSSSDGWNIKVRIGVQSVVDRGRGGGVEGVLGSPRECPSCRLGAMF